jgi:hypothetical protein
MRAPRVVSHQELWKIAIDARLRLTVVMEDFGGGNATRAA